MEREFSEQSIEAFNFLKLTFILDLLVPTLDLKLKLYVAVDT